ncbi:hypothetical protein DVH24_026961 [Malus domestica]|uniref:Uncharacterized protein n=1 Tax=Malus domestica TaxID=3750 RepID=A0A498IQ22_MALDO|nr:hypothetical protein DVH24_026961 [Malus domestica]
MMSMKFISSFLSFTLLMMAISTLAQTSNDTAGSPVLDTTGQPLQRGVEYYIKPAVTENGGHFTLIDRRNGTCPFYVGQENLSGPDGFPVTFAPFAEVNCVEAKQETGQETERRLIVIGEDENERYPTGNHFKIVREGNGLYSLFWCPYEACPICKFDCTETWVGVLVENGKRLLALDGSALPVEFERHNID